jgi:hypothetical protein
MATHWFNINAQILDPPEPFLTFIQNDASDLAKFPNPVFPNVRFYCKEVKVFQPVILFTHIN